METGGGGFGPVFFHLKIGSYPSVAISPLFCCLPARAFAYVWWSSRTFFIAGAALIPVSGVILFTLASNHGLGILPAGVLAVLACVVLSVGMETVIMRPMTDWHRSSGRRGLSESAVLNSAIVSFELYLLIIDVPQQTFTGKNRSRRERLRYCNSGVQYRVTPELMATAALTILRLRRIT